MKLTKIIKNNKKNILIICCLTILFFGLISLLSSAKPTTKEQLTTSLKASAKQVNSNNSNYPTLSPATLPSKVGTCSAPLSYSYNGNPSPVTCGNNLININDWNAIAALEPKVLTLGYQPSLTEVENTICLDANISNTYSDVTINAPLEANAVQLASLYYGWNYTLNVANILRNYCGQ